MSAYPLVQLVCDMPACPCGGAGFVSDYFWPNKEQARSDAKEKGWSTELYELHLTVLDYCPVATQFLASEAKP